MADPPPATTGEASAEPEWLSDIADGLDIDPDVRDAIERLEKLENSDPNAPGTDERSGSSKTKATSRKQSLDEIRRKHRESMARRRGARRVRIQQLEKQASVEHQRLRRALQCVDEHRCRHSVDECRCAAYVELVQATEALLDEQQALEDGLQLREQYARMVSGEADRLEQASRAGYSNQRDADSYWVRYLETEPAFLYECVTTTEIHRVVRDGLQRMEMLRRALAQVDDPRVLRAHCLGWDAERMIEKLSVGDLPTLRFRFTRRVSRTRTSLEQLDGLTWAMLNSPELMARTYGSAVVAKAVQHVDDDTFVLLRNSPECTNHKQFRYFSLNSRARSADGQSVRLLMMFLDKTPPPTNDDDHGVVWLSHGGACATFTHVDGDAIEIEYTGFIQCLSDDHAAHLMIESCASLSRWEHHVVPPRLLA